MTRQSQREPQSAAARSGATTAVRANARFDVTRLERWLQANVEGYRGPVTVEQFAGGQSNPTFLLSAPSGRYVMRRRPAGALLKGAHAVDREARVMQALGRAGFPVPHVHALCADDSVIGSWFFVMDMVPGRIFWDGAFEGSEAGERAALQDAMGRTIAKLHTIDPDAVGLGDFGRPGRFMQRQIDRWSRQYREDELAGRSADMDFLVEWLPAHAPEDVETRIVHGDYRIDNLIFDPVRAEVAAVLDWELSTLGHPLVDFAYHLMAYRVPSDLPWGLAGRDLDALGLPDEEAYVAAYCRRTGRSGVDHLDVYLAFNLFRFAAILHGIKGRLLRGNASSDQAGKIVAHLDLVAGIARGIVEGKDAL